MNRSLKLSMLVALALGSSQVLALDMGQIQVKSALWQPLLAEIPINAATPADLKGLTVQLASNEDFARAGIVGGRTNVPLSFSVVNSGGRPVIRITSTVAVNDPYLDLLLEVNDHAGKSVREFAILLDPPNSTPGASVVAAPQVPVRSAPPVRQARATPSTATAAAPAPAPRPRRPAAEPKSDEAAAGASKGKYGPVESGQTLSSIARSTAPGVGVSMNQMLIALKQANPDAFYRDNINALKRGAILRIPTAAEAQTLAAAAAVAEVQQQNSDWRAGRVGKSTTVADAATRSPASGAASSGSNTTTDRLALVSPADQQGASGQGGRIGGKGDQSSAGLRQELQRTKESLASVQQQSNDLKTRLQDLNDINSKNERLLSLKDNQIAELQAKLAEARKAAGLPAQPAPVVAATPASVAPAVAKPPVTVAATGTAVAPGATATASASAAAPVASSSLKTAPVAAAAPAAVKPKPVIVPTPTPVAEDPWYMQTWAWAAGAGAVVLLVLLALLGRRRKAAAAVESSPGSLADRFGSESIGHDPSDIDQNELLDQLAEHPDDIGLHLELVTLYYSRRDVDHFEAAAEAMHAHITDTDQDEWQDVLHMGEDLAPGHPLFDHHVELPPHEIHEARRAFDIDHYASDDVIADFETPAPKTPSAMPPLPPSKMVSEYHFNFDGAKPEVPSAAASTPEDHAVAPPLSPPDSHDELSHAAPIKAASNFGFAEPQSLQTEAFHKDSDHGDSHGLNLDDFNDDPVDTKLDLARAYVDMGDADGARAMLGEVLKEGTQIQQDVAKRLLETLH
ncbi:FimV/HubP family polar landmark protein [Rhodanobacter sp. BL-MT-08]